MSTARGRQAVALEQLTAALPACGVVLKDDGLTGKPTRVTPSTA